ncbi:type II toxin-antitoxin system PemK/MazF family toxin [Candidatus Acetothermia bacterium]|nr:type II toxin-antitoxin system PemK/MazF family toxin [Candidatus Acetothermia bacterium]
MNQRDWQWTVFLADLSPIKGAEQAGPRPVLVISRESFNQAMPVVTVLPLTSLKRGRRIYPHEVLLPKGQAGLPQASIVLAHQVRTIDKTRLRSAFGTVSDMRTQVRVQQALRVHLDL